jgi:hypothetical protein
LNTVIAVVIKKKVRVYASFRTLEWFSVLAILSSFLLKMVQWGNQDVLHVSLTLFRWLRIGIVLE